MPMFVMLAGFTDRAPQRQGNDRPSGGLQRDGPPSPSRTLTEQRTSMAAEKIGPAERARLHSILIGEADNFTRHLLPKLRPDWEYVPSA
jgi:hypothetical protein